MKLKINQKAPDFTLFDQSNKPVKPSMYKGKWILVYFYPRDFTPGCTKEACSIRDEWQEFKKQGIVVLGISTDSIQSHEKFAKFHKLPFKLLADNKREVVKLYGVWGEKKFLGKTFQGTRRTSFLIDPEGKIARIYEKVKPAEHAAEVLRDVTHQRP